jgi:acetyl-CoA carboxylase alpha subunit
MKVTIDLADVNFQNSVTKAVEAKIEELCKAAMQDKIDYAIAQVVPKLMDRMTKIAEERLDKAFSTTPWANSQTAGHYIRTEARDMIYKIVLSEFTARFGNTPPST